MELKDAGRYAEFLRLAVRKHQTIVVSGKTGSGKTTFMKGLVEEVPKHERLITIQDTAELTLPNHPNVVHLFYSKDAQGTARVTAKSLLEACLRMKPDRIFLAEVRGDECFYFVRLAASGHPGSITSVHAGSCALAFEQMSLMIRETGAGGGLRMNEIKWLLSVVVDVIVQFDRDERGRFISEILYEPPAPAARALGSNRRRQHEQRRGPAVLGLAHRAARSRRAPSPSPATSALACAAVYLAGVLFLVLNKANPQPGAVHQHRPLLGPVRRRCPAAQEAAARDRRLGARAAGPAAGAAWSPPHGRGGRCMAMPGSPARPRSIARAAHGRATGSRASWSGATAASSCRCPASSR